MDQITKLLSDYSWRLTYEDLDPQTVHQVRRTTIDTLGCAMGGYLSEPARIARQLAGSVTAARPARILGTRDSSSLDLAAFANGVMTRYLDCNDSYFSPGGGHPSDMIPAALAVADTLNSDGKAVITAIALAYEVFCRLSDQVVTGDLGWDQGMFIIVGATCAAGKLMSLSQEQMGHAISLAIAPNLPLGVTRFGELSMWKGCATATATRAGVFAAQLAAEGMTGPAEPFEGRRGLWEQAGITQPVTLDEFGGQRQPFLMNDTTFKFYPSQIHTQAPIGLAIELQPQVNVADIKAINVQTYKSAVSSPATEPEKWDPKTRETADHSIPFLVALALHDGAVTPGSFTAERIADPSIRTLIGKTTLEEGPDFTQKYPAQYNCRIEVTLASGATVAAATSYPKGHRKNPLDDAEVERKFRDLASPVITGQQCRGAMELLWNLDSLPNLNEVFNNLIV